MRILVKTLSRQHFNIEADPTDSILAVKKLIEDVQGEDVFPAARQLLIHKGSVLDDNTTLDDNKVNDNSFLIVMLSKKRIAPTLVTSSSSASALSTPPTATHAPASSPAAAPILPPPAIPIAIETLAPSRSPPTATHVSASSSAPAAPILAPPTLPMSINPANPSYQSASNVDVGTTPDAQIIQHLMEVGGGNWDREKVTAAVGAAYNNPERAVEYLYTGIPESKEVALPTQHASISSQGAQSSRVTALTSEQSAVIDGFEAMGFNRNDAIDALFACDNNDEKTLNYLLELARRQED